MHVDDDQGLVIEKVTPDSPAAKAGFEPHDILLKAGKKPLKQIADLAGAIQEAKDQALLLEFKRDGKLLTIAVTPAKRPSGGLTFRLVNPEIRFGPADAAPAEKPGAERSVRKAINFLQAREGESEQPESRDTEARERALLAQWQKLQERFKSLNEKLGSLSNNSDQSAAESIRTEMHAVERAKEAIKRQIEMTEEHAVERAMEANKRQQLTRQLMTLRQCANDLAEVGRTEEASHLGSAAHEIEQQLQAIELGAEQRRLCASTTRSNCSTKMDCRNKPNYSRTHLGPFEQRSIGKTNVTNNRPTLLRASNNSDAKPSTADSARGHPTRRSSVFAIRSSKCIARWRN